MSRIVQQWRQPIWRLLSGSKSFSTMWVENFGSLLAEAHEAGRRGESGDKHHWLFGIGVNRLNFDSHQALSDYYTRYVASVCNKSKEEAEKKIYLAGCTPYEFGFGVCLDEPTMIKLQRRRCPLVVYEDIYHAARPKDSHVVPQFTTKNQNRRLNNIFSYQRLSEPSAEWNSNYWLVTVRKPYGGFSGGMIEATKFCVKILANVVGSEDAAKKMIYMVWAEGPLGFAAKMDEDTLNKLKVAQDVMTVHPDHSFDVKYESDEIVIIVSS